MYHFRWFSKNFCRLAPCFRMSWDSSWECTRVWVFSAVLCAKFCTEMHVSWRFCRRNFQERCQHLLFSQEKLGTRTNAGNMQNSLARSTILILNYKQPEFDRRACCLKFRVIWASKLLISCLTFETIFGSTIFFFQQKHSTEIFQTAHESEAIQWWNDWQRCQLTRHA